MKKLNLILLVFVIVLASAVVLFISTTYAEDTKPAEKKDQGEKGMSCGCGMMGKSDGKMGMGQGMMGESGGKMGMGQGMMGESGGKMGMGQGMMCPNMQKKMEGGMQMGNMPMMGSIVDQIMANADKIQFTQKDKLDNLVSTHRTPDLKAVADQFKKVSGLEADLKYSEFEFYVNIKALLTKEQKDALKTMMNRKDQMGMKMDMPMGKPGQ
jgi:hypothetical protein